MLRERGGICIYLARVIHSQSPSPSFIRSFSPHPSLSLCTLRSSNPPPPQRIIINKDTRTFREKMCARTCKKFPTRRPTTTEEELESGWEPFDEDAFTEKKRAQRKEDEAYRQAHKLVEDLTSGRGDGGEL